MAITKFPPFTIWLGGPRTQIGDVPASAAITPGHLIERFDSAGAPFFRKHSAAGGAGSTYATEQNMNNLSVDVAYGVNDLVEATVGEPGTTIWALIASGQNIANGQKLESAGNGTLRALAAGVAIALAVEAKNNSAGPLDARIRVEVV